jgi:hypothetical protein
VTPIHGYQLTLFSDIIGVQEPPASCHGTFRATGSIFARYKDTKHAGWWLTAGGGVSFLRSEDGAGVESGILFPKGDNKHEHWTARFFLPTTPKERAGAIGRYFLYAVQIQDPITPITGSSRIAIRNGMPPTMTPMLTGGAAAISTQASPTSGPKASTNAAPARARRKLASC